MPSADLHRDPQTLVQTQIDAYNQHDAPAFASVYFENLQLFDLGGELYLFGRDALRERYAQMFAEAPHIHVEIEKRIVVGEFVIDEERITGTKSGRDAHAAVIYEIVDGLIRRVWVARERSGPTGV